MGAVATLDSTTTLEDLVASIWDEVVTTGETDCPVCDGTMRPSDHGAATCESCGSELS